MVSGGEKQWNSVHNVNLIRKKLLIDKMLHMRIELAIKEQITRNKKTILKLITYNNKVFNYIKKKLRELLREMNTPTIVVSNFNTLSQKLIELSGPSN